MQSNNNTSKSGGNGGDDSRKKKGPLKRGPGVAELERMMRQQKMLKGNSEQMDENQCSSTLQNSQILPSNFQVLPSLPPSTNDLHQGYSHAKWGTSSLFHHSSYNSSNVVMHTHANSPPSSTPLFSQVPQDKINSYQHSESGGGPRSSIPFYDFLGVKDSEEVRDPEPLQEGNDDIDLNLKL